MGFGNNKGICIPPAEALTFTLLSFAAEPPAADEGTL